MILVRLHRDSITVSHRYHWLLRALGWQERDYEVDWNGVWWVNAATGKPVSLRVHGLIERELARRTAAQRMFVVG